MFTKDDVGEPARADGRRLSAAERQAIADAWNTADAAKPMNAWRDTMTKSDATLMPRWAEDIVDALEGAGAHISPETLARRNTKRALRSTKP